MKSVNHLLSSMALLCSLLLPACNQPTAEQQMFERLLVNDYGYGMRLGISPGQVTPTLGVPDATATKQAGTVVEHYYLPLRETVAGADRPQLRLTYVNGELVQIYNFERPFETEPAQPEARYKFSIMSGLLLGARKSEFTSKLGPPNAGALKDQWRFTGEDGRSIAVQAFFIEDPDSKAPICNKLSVILAPKLDEPRGEQYDGKK